MHRKTTAGPTTFSKRNYKEVIKFSNISVEFSILRMWKQNLKQGLSSVPDTPHLVAVPQRNVGS